MSTRRARIKAVASLPVRKRPQIIEKSDEGDRSSSTEVITTSKNQTDERNASVVCQTSASNDNSSLNVLSNENLPVVDAESSTSNSDNLLVQIDPVKNEKSTQEPTQRRRIVKPTINIPNSSRKGKNSTNVAVIVSKQQTNTIEEKTSPHKLKKTECISNNSPEISLPVINNASDNNAKAIPLKANNINIVKKLNASIGSDSDFARCEKVAAPDISIDGITPLVQAKRSVADGLLTSECSFDPIVPLPSACLAKQTNRPKLKPMPRFALRRNSLQGSASESEDDARRVKREEAVVSSAVRPPAAHMSQTATPHEGRVRHDSVCSATGDSVISAASRQKPSRVWRTSGAGGEVARRAAARRRALHKPPHNALTMYDLIFYNPPNNSINNTIDENKKNVKPEVSSMKSEEPTKDVAAPAIDQDNDKEEAMPVPQVKLGPNGEIVIDEQSLVIETSEAVRSRQRISTWSVVYDSEGGGGGLYARCRRSRDWSQAETLRFFRALNTLGTDFSLMLKLFPGRTRRDLKVKFKKEEKHNSALVERALMYPLSFSIDKLEKQLETEQEAIRLREEMETTLKLQRKTERVNYRKSSACSRSIITSDNQEHSIPEKKMKKVRIQNNSKCPTDSLRSDDLAKVHSKLTQAIDTKKQSSPERSKEGNSFAPLPSPSTFLPKNVESGSMVILSSEVAGKPNQKIYQAYIVDIIDGVTKMKEIALRPDILESIASKMKVIDVNKHKSSTDMAAVKCNSDSSSIGATNRISCPDSLVNCDDPTKGSALRSPLMDNSRNINFKNGFHNMTETNS